MSTSRDASGYLSGTNQEELLAQIKEVLSSTPIERWIQEGRALPKKKRLSYSLEYWEYLFWIEMSKGLLILRKSQPVNANFFGSGFEITANGTPRFTVELRSCAWNPRTLTDREYRCINSDESCEVLAEGRSAREIFEQLQTAYLENYGTEREDFEQRAEHLLNGIREKTVSIEVTWEKEERKSSVSYAADIEDMTVSLTRVCQNGLELYSATLREDQESYVCFEKSITQSVFQMVEEVDRKSRLKTIHGALRELT